MPEISQKTQKLIQGYKNWHQSLEKKEGVAVLHVDEVAASVAAFYEKIRGVIEWKEEHLLRKTAIERMLKRRFFLMEDGENIAKPLVLELIRGGHFPNDSIEETRVQAVQRLIQKYISIMKNAPPPRKEKTKNRLFEWLLGIAACEIEEVLDPPRKERALIDYMTESMVEKIEVKQGIFVFKGISEEEKRKQIYIAVQKTLFNLDHLIISYHLLKFYYPQWQNLSREQLEEITRNIYSIWKKIRKNLRKRLAEGFYRVCKRYGTPYLILGDILSQDPMAAKERIFKPESLEALIKEAYGKRLVKLKAKLLRAAIYGVISIFITKILVSLLIEIPFDKYITHQFSYLTLALNIFIPPLLMFLMVLTIRPPSKENLQRVILEVMKIVYENEQKDIYPVKLPPKRGPIMESVLFAFYLFSFIVSFGIIVWGLQKLEFGILSIIIFIIFLSLILFAGTRVRHRSKELRVEEEKETMITSFFDFLTLPFVLVGRWLSSQWERFNVLMVIFNIFIELPFKSFTEFLEQWRYFLKEKKEEIH
ncbi:MAG: hypothetical protein A2Z78_00560 [Candidatus Nealsonbacteria bacterium RBG_13_36_15]|uniref:Uncharacterized protein n=1 Tax=Candidatus Nealsonbacteria bacterium RBG_13_36_15 TaxID=1801660 RepID=A0A1G2DXX3_9BACT|nr:MAG: hypothetical protein A2Z78_00560 [Candidatus Nealsonbacteria bacterium RBG_13_36_15]